MQRLLRSSAKLTSATLRHGATLRAAMIGAPVRARGRFVKVAGIRVHYIVRGRGRPVILLHGNGAMAEDFDISGLIDHLAKKYRVIAIDRPGFGRTRRPRYRVWTPAAQADVIDCVMARLKVERPVIVGHSWATIVAIELGRRGSSNLRGLVLLSGYFFEANREAIAFAAPLGLPGIGDAARAMISPSMNRAIAQQVFRHVFRPQPVPTRFKRRFPVKTALGTEQLRSGAEDTAIINAAVASLRPVYRTLQVPVAILAGDADAVVNTSAQSSRLHGEIPGSVLTVLPGKGHMIHYSNRREIARNVDRIMDWEHRRRSRRTL